MTGCYEKSRKNLALEKGLLVLMALFLFQDAIQNVCGVFKGFDEIATAVLFGIWMGKTAKCRRTEKGTVLICCCAGYLILVGLLGNCYHTRQPAEAVLKDAVLCFKFVILYLSVNELLKATDKAWLRVHAKKIVRYTVRIMVPTALIYFFLFSDWKDGEQFSIPYQQTFFSHPTYYAGFCFALCAIWILCSETLKKEDYKVLIYLSVMMLSTQRAKAFAAAAVLWIFVIITASRIKISIITYLFCGAASLAVALPKIKYYFWTITDSARRMLMLAGIQVAADYFPLGGGFASFGTATSGEYYSPLYGLYRLNHIYGLTRENPAFAADNFWSAVLGQFGYTGLLCFCLMIALLWVFIREKAYMWNEKLAVHLIFLYLLISSTAESSFFNPMAVAFFYILGVLL